MKSEAQIQNKDDLTGLVEEGIRLTNKSAKVEKGVSKDSIKRATELAAEVDDATPWWIGDLMAQAKTRFSKSWAKEFAENLPIEYRTLKNYFYISKKIPEEIRSDALTWSHHKEVAKLDSKKERRIWLTRAEEEDLSVRDLRERINEAYKDDREKQEYDLDGHQDLSNQMMNILDEADIGAFDKMTVTVDDGLIEIERQYDSDE